METVETLTSKGIEYEIADAKARKNIKTLRTTKNATIDIELADLITDDDMFLRAETGTNPTNMRAVRLSRLKSYINGGVEIKAISADKIDSLFA